MNRRGFFKILASMVAGICFIPKRIYSVKFHRPIGGVPKRKDTKFLGEADSAKKIVSMTEFQNRIYIATEKCVYRIENEKLVRLEFVEKKQGES